ncbi:hypothetical protein FNV43_RR06243 [Rhamnella rubrinervis]|uniref:Photosystem I reaction center subunit III n=1 Tax=Rhamnella rubrinervis TaxID=2594499 RepID=A0A8K0HE77_9ROSA|nr:hypothetical protein FNV43_RR06243 [Rhamnella rubrinervis]
MRAKHLFDELKTAQSSLSKPFLACRTQWDWTEQIATLEAKTHLAIGFEAKGFYDPVLLSSSNVNHNDREKLRCSATPGILGCTRSLIHPLIGPTTRRGRHLWSDAMQGLQAVRKAREAADQEAGVVAKLYAPDSAPALAINATIEKTKRRFDNYGKQGLLCGSDGLPHLIVSGDQRHWGEFITPGILFLYIAGWIGWVGRSYLIAIRGEKKPTQKEIIIDVPLASRLVFRGFIWPVAAYREFVNGDLVAKDV